MLDQSLLNSPSPPVALGSQVAAKPPRFQYSLRTLMQVMGLLSVLFAGMSAIGPGWSILIGWCVVLIAAHVMGNAWGTRNKSLAADPHPDDALAVRPRTAPAVAFAPPTRLRKNASPGLAMFTLACVGAAIGGTIGSLLLWKPQPPPGFLIAYVVGVASASVVGGFVGYLIGCFSETALSAWREAADPNPKTREE